MSKIDPNPLAIERSFKQQAEGQEPAQARRADAAGGPCGRPARPAQRRVAARWRFAHLPLTTLRSPARKVRLQRRRACAGGRGDDQRARFLRSHS